MSANGVLAATVAASLVVTIVRALVPATTFVPSTSTATAAAVAEAPWLTREAAAQIIAADGGMGPLFAGVELGGAPPDAGVRARIADFARANAVDIRFEVVDGELVAVRFGVRFGGCCGYEGADVLALRLQRPQRSSCCGCEGQWIDDWTRVSADGRVHVRARVRVNRVEVRWERPLAVADVIDRADRWLGQRRAAVRRAAGDRWFARDGRRDLVEVPFTFIEHEGYASGERDDLGIHLVVDAERIRGVAFVVRRSDDGRELGEALRARWGRPRMVDGVWTWHTRDREIVAEPDGGHVTIAER